MKESSRRWIFASVVAALALTFTLSNINETKLYHAIKTQLAQTGVILDAKGLNLSPMYMGSIRLNDVNIQTQAFTLQAEQISIDLNLAALLTGKALPQALYIRFADINVLQTEKESWLNFIESERFKLKRIDISQSEIHFEQQHITLEQTDLDIRDIGKNKNPRAELRAHIGDGRIDAHGYLHLRHGKLTRGFSRIKLIDIPLSFIAHDTTLETLTGSITAHMYQDKPWQTFGHLALQKNKRNYMELRGKLKENKSKLFVISDMVLKIKDAGNVQISGSCNTWNTCQINSQSTSLNLEPIANLFNNTKYKHFAQNNSLKNILIQTDWNADNFSSQGQFSWNKINYSLSTPLPQQKEVNIGAGKFTFEGLSFSNKSHWHLQSATLSTADNKNASINITSATLQPDSWKVPLQLQHSSLWLPLSQIMFDQQAHNKNISGDGTLTGHLVIKHTAEKSHTINFDIDASQSSFSWLGYKKPKNIPLTLQGNIIWENDEVQPSSLRSSIQLADSYANITFKPAKLTLQNMAIDFNQLSNQGIILAQPLQQWHGNIAGNINIDLEQQQLLHAQLQLHKFGVKKHRLTGQINYVGKQWHIPQLSWQFEKNRVQFTTNQHAQVNINAEYLDSAGLTSLLQIPLTATGSFTAQKLIMPLGTLSQTSATYNLNEHALKFKKLKSHFYQGKLRAKKLTIAAENNQLHITSLIQAGGIRLNSWLWLHKQFDGYLEGSVYATLNLDAHFNPQGKLNSWQGDGDIMVYNAKWLLNNKRIQADKLALSIRKREQFTAALNITKHQQQSSGRITIDADANIAGHFNWQNKSFKLYKTWPHLNYQQQP
ncbi:AsmA family protein [Ghiorsea bivora]|uniref:hypothetical protein n=1 Tax=Ghiorsea bivora TaxID=1485545 RepID=UPI00056EA964|nr:hypothetical protein [Ghiorsea bivora]